MKQKYLVGIGKVPNFSTNHSHILQLINLVATNHVRNTSQVLYFLSVAQNKLNLDKKFMLQTLLILEN